MARNIKFIFAFAVTCWFMWTMAKIYQAQAHSFYSAACCNNDDCAPAEWIKRDDKGHYLVKTKHGVMLFPPDQKILPSPDGKAHGCVFKKQIVAPGIRRGRCLYMGGFV